MFQPFATMTFVILSKTLNNR